MDVIWRFPGRTELGKAARDRWAKGEAAHSGTYVIGICWEREWV